jgi:hypothetical protein
MKIENKPFTFFDYLDSLKRQLNSWEEEIAFKQSHQSTYSDAIHTQAIVMKSKLEKEILTITKQLEV